MATRRNPLTIPDETWIVGTSGTDVILDERHDEEPWGDDPIAHCESTVNNDLDFQRAPLIAAAPDLYRFAQIFLRLTDPSQPNIYAPGKDLQGLRNLAEACVEKAETNPHG